ncbi:signal peptide peptidase SppA [Chloroflexi bacterium TSY]|nr:signal peptide peptidase SppA [Chloroflexi bacterium TSY]
MNRRTLFWIGGLFLALLIGCGLLFAIGINLSEFDTNVGPGVAIVRVEGIILPGEGTADLFGTMGAFSTIIVDHLKQANENEDVKAVILAVDSPGGSVYASDEIALQVEAMDKPIVAAMASMATSGGYYVSAKTDEIWASPHTLTCSIGVIAQFLNYDELAAEYGVENVVIKSGKLKDAGNPFRDFTDEERALWQAMIDEAYDAFVTVVAGGRDMADASVREIADGRVCTGKQAQEMNLIDELGYLPDVIKRAGELGGLGDDPAIIEYKEEPGLFDILTSMSNRPGPVTELRRMLEYRTGSPLMYIYTGQ